MRGAPVRTYVLSAVITTAARSPPHCLDTLQCYHSSYRSSYSALLSISPTQFPEPEILSVGYLQNSGSPRYRHHSRRGAVMYTVMYGCAMCAVPVRYTPALTLGDDVSWPTRQRLYHRGGEPSRVRYKAPRPRPTGHAWLGRSALVEQHIVRHWSCSGARTSRDVSPVLVSDACPSTFLQMALSEGTNSRVEVTGAQVKIQIRTGARLGASALWHDSRHVGCTSSHHTVYHNGVRHSRYIFLQIVTDLENVRQPRITHADTFCFCY